MVGGEGDGEDSEEDRGEEKGEEGSVVAATDALRVERGQPT